MIMNINVTRDSYILNINIDHKVDGKPIIKKEWEANKRQSEISQFCDISSFRTFSVCQHDLRDQLVHFILASCLVFAYRVCFSLLYPTNNQMLEATVTIWGFRVLYRHSCIKHISGSLRPIYS